jgi:D-inositol-3-phosphate glycosyltransferase
MSLPPIGNSSPTEPNISERIALVCLSDSLGGLELTTLRLAKSMTARGRAVLVVAPPRTPLEERAISERLPFSPLSTSLRYGDVFAAIRLVRLVRQHRVGTAVFLKSRDIHLGAIAKTIARSLRIVYYQQMEFGHNKRDVLHTWVYGKLSLWVSLTQRMRELVLENTTVPADMVKVVTLGVDLRHFDPARFSKEHARSFFSLPNERNLVGVLGRLDRGKGQRVLLEAAPAILKRFPDILFVIAGDETRGEPGHQADLKSLSNRLGIQERVRFLPFTEDVPQYMAALDIFVLPSIFETYGLVVIEAMAMGKPIVATNAGGVPEILSNGRCGLLVRPGDAGDLGNAICRLLDDERLRESLGNTARREAEDRFNRESCVDQLLHAIDRLGGQGSSM